METQAEQVILHILPKASTKNELYSKFLSAMEIAVSKIQIPHNVEIAEFTSLLLLSCDSYHRCI